MKAVMISIQPKWCELIASGKKTVEVRKTRPKIETPFKCYIYMTAGDAIYPVTINGASYTCSNNGGKCVIGEFICDKIERDDLYSLKMYGDYWKETTCLTQGQLIQYGKFNELYFWHISDLVIYDEPKVLSKFYTKCNEGCENCDLWQFVRVNSEEFDMECSSEYYGFIPLKRPPQSWCYIEERRCE